MPSYLLDCSIHPAWVTTVTNNTHKKPMLSPLAWEGLHALVGALPGEAKAEDLERNLESHTNITDTIGGEKELIQPINSHYGRV